MAGGGTGGHLYPALAVADELRRRRPDASIVFVGARRGIEQRLVPRAGYPLLTLPLAGLKGSGGLARIGSVAAAGWAVVRCTLWMLRRRPDVVIGVGGYASGPAVLAAKLARRPTMVMEQNHFPGATNRWLAPRVDAVCVPSDAALQRHRQAPRNRRRHRESRCGRSSSTIGDPPLAAMQPSILVFGGSRGAHSINRRHRRRTRRRWRLPSTRSACWCLQTGADDEETEVRAGLQRRTHPGSNRNTCAFIDDMPARLAMADLVVCSRRGIDPVRTVCRRRVASAILDPLSARR